MRRIKLIFAATLAMAITVTVYGQRIQLVPNEADKKINVIFNGTLFTSYIYPDDLEKPVLYPLYNSNGTSMVRGFPRDPIPGERIDHPHHVGLWFNYGDVNGLDFWNNSYAISENQKNRYGSIRHTGVSKMESGDEKAILVVTSNWNDSEGKTLLKAETEYIFAGEGYFRTIEHIVKLTAQDDPVVFGDSKEGLFGVRLDRAFEEVSDDRVIHLGMDSRPMKEPMIDNEGVNGTYSNSLGQEKEAGTWGKRAEWAMVSANKEGDDTSLAILDHKDNIGFPAHWHTRGYGLFAANNLGSSKFFDTEPVTSFTLNPGESVTFRHKIVIKAGSFADYEEIKSEFGLFNK